MIITLIAAITENGVIGKNNQLPFKLADDMRHFVRTTKGHTVISGRLNFESIGKALPNRTNIIISRNSKYIKPNTITLPSIEEAFELAYKNGETEVFVIGGGQIYELALPYADRFYRTKVFARISGDVFFPEFNELDFEVEILSEHKKDENNEYDFRIELLKRKR